MRIRFGRYGINDRDGGEAAAVCNLKITGEAVPNLNESDVSLPLKIS